MPYNSNSGGPWGGGGGNRGDDDQNKGQRPPNRGPQPVPDIDELMRKGQEKIKDIMGGGGGRGGADGGGMGKGGFAL
ncbi:MAG TPA: HflK protein, partial [Rhodobacteraceae bacterium]|nr:HflK protein [Paracoccaceae bacterium]